MKIEYFDNIKIAYMRRVGPYGNENYKLMSKLKEWLKFNGFDLSYLTVLAIALDNPLIKDSNKLRYDVAFILESNQVVNIDTRYLDSCEYAVFDVEHTKEGVTNFYQNYIELTKHLNVKHDMPIIERYRTNKLDNNLCEICIPINTID